MSEIVRLPENFIGKDDRERLESFGGHTVAHGRATRWHWTADEQGGDVFEIYQGGANEELAYRISRNRKEDVFRVRDGRGRELLSGDLAHVMTKLDEMLSADHGESPA